MEEKNQSVIYLKAVHRASWLSCVLIRTNVWLGTLWWIKSGKPIDKLIGMLKFHCGNKVILNVVLSGPERKICGLCSYRWPIKHTFVASAALKFSFCVQREAFILGLFWLLEIHMTFVTLLLAVWRMGYRGMMVAWRIGLNLILLHTGIDPWMYRAKPSLLSTASIHCPIWLKIVGIVVELIDYL